MQVKATVGHAIVARALGGLSIRPRRMFTGDSGYDVSYIFTICKEDRIGDPDSQCID